MGRDVMGMFFGIGLWVLLTVICWVPGTGATDRIPPFHEKTDTDGDATGPNPEVDTLLEDKGFATQEYVVQEGDWLTKILRKKGLLGNYDTDELLEILRRLNTSLKNINLIRPGEKIVILVKVMPKSEAAGSAKYHTYTVRPGDSLHKLATARYGLSEKAFVTQYMPLLEQYNPGVEDLNRIHPGQKINLPVYPPPAEAQPADSPAIARDMDTSEKVTLADPRIVLRSFNQDVQPVAPAPSAPPAVKQAPPEPPPEAEPAPAPEASPVADISAGDQSMVIVLANDMGRVFHAMGEELVDQGDHFIPMKSGGQINLSAQNYPLLRLGQGTTVIVDLSNALPRKMINLIESTWSGYRVVAISSRDTLRSALGKVLRACNYARIFKRGEPLELGGSVRVRVTGDWIVVPPDSGAPRDARFIVISLTGPHTKPLPESIEDYLRLLGIDVIEYPPVQARNDTGRSSQPVKAARDAQSLIRRVLEITGRPHTSGQQVAAFMSQKNDFELTVKADFLLQKKGKKAIIDVSGLDTEVVSLLQDRGVEVLSASEDAHLLPLLHQVLTFLDITHKEGPHTFAAVPGGATTNVQVTLPGVVFRNPQGTSILATSASLPDDVVRFLSKKGYQVLVVSEGPAKAVQQG